MSAQPEGFLFNRSDKVGMDGDQCDGDHALYLDDDFPGAGSLDLDKHTFASLEYSSRYPDLLRFCEIDLGGTEKTQGLVTGSRHRDECPHLLLGDSDLLAESLIHHVLQHGNAGGLLKLLDSGCGGAYEYDVVDHRYEALFSGSGGFLVLHRNEVFHAFLVQKPFGLQLTVVGDPHREPHQFLSLAWSAHLLSC